jgi:hypothetical protein
MAVANIRSLFSITDLHTAKLLMQETEQYARCIISLFCVFTFSIYGTDIS